MWFFNIFLFEIFQPEKLKPKKTKILYMLSYMALSKYFDKDPH